MHRPLSFVFFFDMVSCKGIIITLQSVPLYCLRCESIEVTAIKEHHNANARRPHDFVLQLYKNINRPCGCDVG